MDIYGKIAQTIRSIADAPIGGATIFPAIVKQVDGATCTITIGNLDISDVRLRAVVNNQQDQLLMTPKQQSQVLVADMSGGELRELVVIAYSEIETLNLTIGQTSLKAEDGQITINGGYNNGLVKIKELTDKLNNLAKEINAIKNKFNAHTHSVETTAPVGTWITKPTTNSAADVSGFNKTDYEDTNIKH